MKNVLSFIKLAMIASGLLVLASCLSGSGGGGGSQTVTPPLALPNAQPLALPSAPTGVGALLNNGTNAPNVTVNWNANPVPESVTGYNIYRSLYPNSIALPANRVVSMLPCEGGNCSGKDAGLTTGTYYYSVTAVNSTGESLPGFLSQAVDIYVCPGDIRCSAVPATVSVNSFTPTSGMVNTQVVISGSGFNAIPTSNVVKFNNIGTQVIAGTTTSLTVNVPPNAFIGCNNTISVSGIPAQTTFCVQPSTNPALVAPTPITQPATAIGQTFATFNASLNPNGQITTGYFRYGAGLASPPFSVPAGTGFVSVTWPTGSILTPGTTYPFELIASNASGTVSGGVQSFTTVPLPQPPQIQIIGLNVSASAASINVQVNPNGAPTNVLLNYGVSAGYGGQTPTATITGNTFTPVTMLLNNLTPNTLYHYQVQASNGMIKTTLDQTFITSVAPVLPPAAPVFGTTQPFSFNQTPYPYCNTSVRVGPAVWLSWNGIRPVGGYFKLERTSPLSGITTMMANGTNPILTGTTFDNNVEIPNTSNQPLTAGLTYGYRVSAIDAMGVSSVLQPWSNISIPANVCTGCTLNSNVNSNWGAVCRVSGVYVP